MRSDGLRHDDHHQHDNDHAPDGFDHLLHHHDSRTDDHHNQHDRLDHHHDSADDDDQHVQHHHDDPAADHHQHHDLGQHVVHDLDDASTESLSTCLPTRDESVSGCVRRHGANAPAVQEGVPEPEEGLRRINGLSTPARLASTEPNPHATSESILGWVAVRSAGEPITLASAGSVRPRRWGSSRPD